MQKTLAIIAFTCTATYLYVSEVDRKHQKSAVQANRVQSPSSDQSSRLSQEIIAATGLISPLVRTVQDYLVRDHPAYNLKNVVLEYSDPATVDYYQKKGVVAWGRSASGASKQPKVHGGIFYRVPEICYNAFSENTVAFVDNTDTINLWNLTIPKFMYVKHLVKIRSFNLSPDEELLAFGDYAGNLTVVNLKNKLSATSFTGANCEVTHVQFFSQGKSLIAASATDIFAWNVRSTPSLTVFAQNTLQSPVGALHINPEGTMLVAGAWGDVTLWRNPFTAPIDSPEADVTLLQIPGPGCVSAVQLSLHNQLLAIGVNCGDIYCYDITQDPPLLKKELIRCCLGITNIRWLGDKYLVFYGKNKETCFGGGLEMWDMESSDQSPVTVLHDSMLSEQGIQSTYGVEYPFCLSPDGEHIAFVTLANQALSLFEKDTYDIVGLVLAQSNKEPVHAISESQKRTEGLRCNYLNGRRLNRCMQFGGTALGLGALYMAYKHFYVLPLK